MRFGPALPVGVEGREEFVDLSVTRKLAGVVAALNEHLPSGLSVRRARYLPPGARCAHAPVERARYRVWVPEERREALRDGIANFRNRESWCIQREGPGNASVIDLKSQVTRLRTDDGSGDGIELYFECDLSVEGLKLRPHELVAALLACPVEDISTLTLRREQLLSRGDEPMGPWRTPMELVDLATHRSRQMVKRYS
jgi:radical SAM-linked protein